MSAPVRFSIGDILATGKLIGQIVVELHKTGEAAPEYQSLVVELEALQRALHQLESLTPAKNELRQLTSIRAMACACRRPLQDFLDKISKFEKHLGSFTAPTCKMKGFPRRAQWKTMFDKDIEHLRSTLASHVATINMLLMTQAVNSITAAESDRDQFASKLERQILAHPQLLREANRCVETCVERQQEVTAQLSNQSSILAKLEEGSEEMCQQLKNQEASLSEIQAVTDHSQKQTASVLTTMTKVLARVTSGLMCLRQITKQLNEMIRLCASFATEMRSAMAKLLALFVDVRNTLVRIEGSLPVPIHLPTLQFTTALGETMALPYQLCQHWDSFQGLLGVVFLNKPGRSRVDMGKYVIMNARGGRRLAASTWQYAVRQGDHLLMSMVVDELVAKSGSCPYPTCQASTEGADTENGGRNCGRCGRWSSATLQQDHAPRSSIKILYGSGDNGIRGNDDVGDEEDIELYRYIHAQYLPAQKSRVPYSRRWELVCLFGNNWALMDTGSPCLNFNCNHIHPPPQPLDLE